MPRSAIIWTRSRELSLNVRYHRTHRTIISWSKCRPLKSSCAEAGSVIQAVTAGSRAFQVCTRTLNHGPAHQIVNDRCIRNTELGADHSGRALSAEAKRSLGSSSFNELGEIEKIIMPLLQQYPVRQIKQIKPWEWFQSGSAIADFF